MRAGGRSWAWRQSHTPSLSVATRCARGGMGKGAAVEVGAGNSDWHCPERGRRSCPACCEDKAHDTGDHNRQLISVTKFGRSMQIKVSPASGGEEQILEQQ